VNPDLAELEMQESSELMEDLYKILPLTVDSIFDETSNEINCQFDTLTDLETASNILTLVFKTHIDSNVKTTTKK